MQRQLWAAVVVRAGRVRQPKQASGHAPAATIRVRARSASGWDGRLDNMTLLFGGTAPLSALVTFFTLVKEEMKEH
jgi:hypothetical protein